MFECLGESKPKDERLIAAAIAVTFCAGIVFVGLSIKRERAVEPTKAAAQEPAPDPKKKVAEIDANIAKLSHQNEVGYVDPKVYETLPGDTKARIQFAKLIEAAYQKDGRRIGVAATGDNYDTLELYSGLIMEGTYTLEAAREIYGDETMKMVRQLKFRRIVIRGTESGYSESLEVH